MNEAGIRINEEAIIGFLNCLTGTAKIEYLSLSIYCSTPLFMNYVGTYLQKARHLKGIHIVGGTREETKDEEKKPL